MKRYSNFRSSHQPIVQFYLRVPFLCCLCPNFIKEKNFNLVIGRPKKRSSVDLHNFPRKEERKKQQKGEENEEKGRNEAEEKRRWSMGRTDSM